MSHKWTRDTGLREIAAIMSSSGSASHPTQVPKAVLRALSMLYTEDRGAVMEKFLTEHNPLNPGRGRQYDFSEPLRMPLLSRSYMCILFRAGASATPLREVAEKVAVEIDARNDGDQLALMMTLAFGSIAMNGIGVTVIETLRGMFLQDLDLNCEKCEGAGDCGVN